MKKSESQESVLGIRVDVLKKETVIDIITEKIRHKATTQPCQIITAYSEFFVTAQKDQEFARVLRNADLVIPDGVAPLAAISYSRGISAQSGVFKRLAVGLLTGSRVLSGGVGEVVSGVELFRELTRLAAENNWRVFLLGGFDNVASQLAAKLHQTYPQLQIASSPGEASVGQSEAEAAKVLAAVNLFKPDLLFVAYGPVKQEKWIAKNLSQLHCRVAIGVGGTFDELSGRVASPPAFLSRLGLKWLGRLLIEPKRLPRIIIACIVFPWLVFRESLPPKY